MIDKLIERYQNDMIQKTQELIQIPSVFSPSNNPLHPFGKPIHDAFVEPFPIIKFMVEVLLMTKDL